MSLQVNVDKNIIPVAIEDVATAAALDAKLIAANEGKGYRFTGTTTDKYIQNDIYVVQKFETLYPSLNIYPGLVEYPVG